METIDLHCDTIAALMTGVSVGTLHTNSGQVDMTKLRAGGVGGQFFACYFDKETTTSPYRTAKEMLAFAKSAIADLESDLVLVTAEDDVKSAKRTGKIAAFLTIEEGGALEGQIMRLGEFYDEGVRLLTLTWNYPNEIGYPNIGYRDADKGLTPFGRDVIGEMQRLGMIVDVSHLSDQGFYDVAKLATRPFVASHSNARSVTDHSRNLTDDMIRRIAQSGGVIGLNFANCFLGASPISRIADMVRHVQHIYRVGGADVLALGTDFDGIDPQTEIADASQLPKLWQALSQVGFTANEIDKMRSDNVRRLLHDCL